MLHDIQRKAGSLNRGSLPLGFLLALIGSEKESNDLCAGAAIVRPEQAITNAVCDAVLHGPCHSVCIVAIGENIAELCLAIDQLTNGTEQESHALGTGADGVRTEFAIACAGDDSRTHGSVHGLQCVAGDLLIVHILPDGHAALGGVIALFLSVTPQHGGHLLTGDRIVGAESAIAIAAHHALRGSGFETVGRKSPSSLLVYLPYVFITCMYQFVPYQFVNKR